MNELKPEDVMRALECCTTDKITLGVPCRNCPYNECNIVSGKGERQTSGTCRSWLMKDALALLREKDAEIERLKQEHKDYIEDITALLSEKNAECEKLMRENAVYTNGVEKVAENYHRQGRAEAITEFHRKYHEHLNFMNNINKPSPSWNTDDIQRVIVACGAIADQVKNEMKGETDGKTDL